MAVRVLTDKSTYNQLELPCGRMAQVKKGDVLAGVLGHRQALFGYSGHLPERLAPGDTRPPAEPRRRARHLRLGQPRPRAARSSARCWARCCTFRCSASGSASRRQIGPAIPLDLRGKDLPPLDARGVPVVAIVGSCMNAGKTAAACALISEITHAGLHGRRLQGDRRLAAPRRAGDGGRRGAPHRAVHRPRGGLDHAEERRRGHPHDAHRSRRRRRRGSRT